MKRRDKDANALSYSKNKWMDGCSHCLKSCIFQGPDTGNLTWKRLITIVKALTVWVAEGRNETIKTPQELL